MLAGLARVIEKTGNDVTQLYIDGAWKALNFAREHCVTHVVLKEASLLVGVAIFIMVSLMERQK